VHLLHELIHAVCLQQLAQRLIHCSAILSHELITGRHICREAQSPLMSEALARQHAAIGRRAAALPTI
jgi:hypothetical protein